MADIGKLIEIAHTLGLQKIEERLVFLREREQIPDKELIIPLVGEFSSGKTTLLNALTSGKKLETARERTTATIFEVYFSQDTEHAVIFWENGTQEEVSDISELKNDHLGSASLVRVYDTSKSVPALTIIVDTPGLSSPVPKDREAISAYLPRADAALVVIDINTGDISRSLLEFLKEAELARRRVYIILTKTDTKAASEQEEVRIQVAKTLNIPAENIACVSAYKGEISELMDIIADIQSSKNKIASESIMRQTEAIQKNLLEQVMLLSESSEFSTEELDREIAAAKRAQNTLKTQIQRLVSSVESSVESIAAHTVSDFNSRIAGSLDGIIKNPPAGQDINQAVRSAVNRTASIMYSNFKSDVYNEVRGTLRTQFEDGGSFSVSELNKAIKSVDSINELTVNADLSLQELQKANKFIAGALKVTAVAATAVVAGPALLAEEGAAVVAGESAAFFEGAAAMGAGSMIAANQMQNRMREGQLIPEKKQGLIEGFVGKITDRILAKPQRERLINDEIIFNLQPEFKKNLSQISRDIIGNIETLLNNSAQEAMTELKNNLEQLKTQKLEAKNTFQDKQSQLKEYKTILQTGEKH